MSENDLMPNPTKWPVCVTKDPKSYRPDGLCGQPFILRRALTFDGPQWLWYPDCKHKPSARNHAVEVHDENGKVESNEHQD